MRQSALFVTLMLFGGYLAFSEGQEPERPPAANERDIMEQVVFLYYSDLDAAADFYETVMGFRKTYSLEWVKIFQSNQGASVGIVDENKGFLKEAKDKPVMLSWVTNDVDGWYIYLKNRGVRIQTEPKDTPETGIRSFIFSDPGGYTLELFSWTR